MAYLFIADHISFQELPVIGQVMQEEKFSV